MTRSVLRLSAALALIANLTACLPEYPADHAKREVFRAEDESAAARALLGGTTVVTDKFFYGTQIEYHSPDGGAFLWFPGNRSVVAGEWDVRGNRPDLCYRYLNGRDALTGLSGSNWGCEPVRLALSSGQAFLAGDVFGLVDGRLPFVMSKRQKLPDIARIAGLDPATLPYRYPNADRRPGNEP